MDIAVITLYDLSECFGCPQNQADCPAHQVKCAGTSKYALTERTFLTSVTARMLPSAAPCDDLAAHTNVAMASGFGSQSITTSSLHTPSKQLIDDFEMKFSSGEGQAPFLSPPPFRAPLQQVKLACVSRSALDRPQGNLICEM
ncbi:hypothetical protein J6590_046824 [Homalodisca vitripennis]|nr:hypothetical protein J6590_046824 [Homalodisca vitripennis]